MLAVSTEGSSGDLAVAETTVTLSVDQARAPEAVRVGGGGAPDRADAPEGAPSGPEEIDWTDTGGLRELDPSMGIEDAFERLERRVDEAARALDTDAASAPAPEEVFGLRVTEEIIGEPERDAFEPPAFGSVAPVGEALVRRAAPEGAPSPSEPDPAGRASADAAADEAAASDGPPSGSGGFFATLWGLARGLGGAPRREADDDATERRG